MDYGRDQYEENREREMQQRKNELFELSRSLLIIWNLTEIKSIWNKRFDGYAGFSFPDNMDYFFDKIDEIFTWNYVPSIEDLLKGRMQTTGITKQYFEINDYPFTIINAGGQRNERRKWIHSFERIEGIIFVAALNDYAHVLYEDKANNAMIESIQLFAEICNSKWFRRTEIVLFLNKNDLFREYIINDIPLSVCFNHKTSKYRQEYYDVKEPSYPRGRDYNYYRSQHPVYSWSWYENYMNSQYYCNMVIYGYLRDTLKEKKNDYEFVLDIICLFLKSGYSNCSIYPKQDLRYSAKDKYDNGKWKDESDEKWFEFIYNDYLYWIEEQYLCRNLHCNYKRVFVHVITAIDRDNLDKVFLDIYDIFIRSGLRPRGLV